MFTASIYIAKKKKKAQKAIRKNSSTDGLNDKNSFEIFKN